MTAVKSDKIAPPKATAGHFPVVGLGASAGGIDALKAFFSAPSGFKWMAYIIVVHLPFDQPSLLAQLLQKITPTPVSTIKDGQSIQPGHIYVNPPGKEILLYKGCMYLLDLAPKDVIRPIDLFLKSLAQDLGRHAVAIILSGTGTDGTLGVKAVKANGGLVLVQSEESAAYDGMPRSAINTGLVDLVRSPEEMPPELARYFKYPVIRNPTTTTPTAYDQQKWLNKIFVILHNRIGHDFSGYKVDTLLRRINRRMELNQIDNYSEYVRFLKLSPKEVEALFRELLIGVTYFFRDAQSFDSLKTNILPMALAEIETDAAFRVWLPGCSTGEEVYSTAIILHECLDNTPKRIHLQLFGTDIDKYAIEKARQGLFPASISSNVPPERLARFFVKENHSYRICKAIRDCTVFSVQDVLKDPPFSHLNLLCCRNLLIYLNSDAQKRLLQLFHHTLIPGGVLILGSFETIDGLIGPFEVIDKKWKIFRRREVQILLKQFLAFPTGSLNLRSSKRDIPTVSLSAFRPLNISQAGQNEIIDQLAPAAVPTDSEDEINISRAAQNAILGQLAPAAVLTDTKGEILLIQGRCGKYLEPPSGPPTQNILDLAREGLRIELTAAIRAARSSNEPITRSGIEVKTNGAVQMINLHVIRQHSPKEIAGRLLVAFEDVDSRPDSSGSTQKIQADQIAESFKIVNLEKELPKIRASHQSAIKELESSNSKFKFANEELHSTNEELQSINEELEASKEELRSLNEDLQTANEELKNKVAELIATHDDIRNLLNNTAIATILVDNDLRLRRFTPQATTIFYLIPADIGRPLYHVVTRLLYDAMITDIAEVLKKGIPKKIEVKTKEGKWFTMRILPYRTIDNCVAGAVLTFTSITEQKKFQALLPLSRLKLKQRWKFVRDIFDLNSNPMLVIDKNGQMVIANTAFYEVFKSAQTDLENMTIKALNGLLPKQVNLEAFMQTHLEKGRDFTTTAFKLDLSEPTQAYNMTGCLILRNQDDPCHILLRFIPERGKL